MLKSNEIIEIIKFVNGSTVDEVHYEHEGFSLRVKNQNLQSAEKAGVEPILKEAASKGNDVKEVYQEETAVQPEQDKSEETQNHFHEITSPMVGTFYASPSPEEPSYVNVGDKVAEDTVLCVLEAMKMFNDIQADVKGEIIEVLVNNGELVEYGQPLFLVKPE
ncbi:acetyl-CoA carboxylase biotin carboxyl carrier protein [Bacillus taeanensis]|uniref:Biotin carboxyl carrier protein of acetyl-CoA carboxylase n=1 Tax=Bacillus taeanensis TaxID=273032 RepID=A0A366XZI7_9BACI|nr:acetyl-CoA carboxylase biotin carboxyl carrier protein [Bacillus taeanensis]RBW69563.1 acetyl-CoA carboxylase biotin carboxyl carrier protein [Bacillus taeanensis]